jgi:hypothetical protein
MLAEIDLLSLAILRVPRDSNVEDFAQLQAELSGLESLEGRWEMWEASIGDASRGLDASKEYHDTVLSREIVYLVVLAYEYPGEGYEADAVRH